MTIHHNVTRTVTRIRTLTVIMRLVFQAQVAYACNASERLLPNYACPSLASRDRRIERSRERDDADYFQQLFAELILKTTKSDYP